MEGENPTRRYKWFRPRQAARGYGAPTQASPNTQSVSLYNNARVTHALVVRAIATASSAIAMVTESRQGVLGTLAMGAVAIFAGEAALPGQVFTNSGEGQLSPDFLVPNNGDQSWNHDFPFSILPPGWSLRVQPSGGSGDIQVSFLWEALTIDELDFLDW